MKLEIKEVDYIIGTSEVAENTANVRTMHPFEDRVVDFLNDLSGVLMKYRSFPDIVTFAFWCRKSSVLQMKSQYDDCNRRVGRGVVFHSTPSNVPMNFAYSFAAGLLAGNANIVRLPAKDFEQVGIVVEAIKTLISNDYKDVAPYISFVKYASAQSIHDAFSAACDVRVIWGGDATISRIRKSPLNARAKDITFADRHSIMVIDADAYLKDDNKAAVIEGFYNDTYYSDQNACTSPAFVFWKGNEIEAAKSDFWGRVHNMVKERYELAASQAVGKLDAMYKAAAVYGVKVVESNDNMITRLQVDKVTEDLIDFKYNSGFFFENDIKVLEDILQVCTSRCQTLIYYGIDKEELESFIDEFRPRGIDRMVPIGHSMDFSLMWDGYDLIREMSRVVFFT